MQLQLKEIMARLVSSPGSELQLDTRCYRKRRKVVLGSVRYDFVKYSYYDCDAVVVVVSKPQLPAAEGPSTSYSAAAAAEAADSSTFLIVSKEVLIEGGCMASEADSQVFSSLKDHPLIVSTGKSIAAGTTDFLRRPVPVCSEFHPLSLNHGNHDTCHTPVVNAEYKCVAFLLLILSMANAFLSSCCHDCCDIPDVLSHCERWTSAVLCSTCILCNHLARF